MSTTHAQIETTGDHVYLIRVSGDGEVIETTLYADPGEVSRPGLEDVEEPRIVGESTAYLMRRQRADDLPPSLDQADVAAAYEDWVDDMRVRLGHAVDSGTTRGDEAWS